MEFINLGNPVKIRIGEPSDCYWDTIRKGEVVELPAEMGKHYGFSIKTTEGQLGNKKVETKQLENDNSNDDTNNFFKELCSIKGIGTKTAKDIIIIFPKREELINKIRSSTYTNELPFREDVVILLNNRYKNG